jgi:hypothetical protein
VPLSSLFQTGKGLLLARVRGVANPADRFARIEQQNKEILAQLEGIKEHAAEAVRREAQLRAVITRDAELEDELSNLDELLDAERTGAHIARAIDRAELKLHPFPHAIVDDVLPRDLYWALIKAMPPVELFSDRPVNKQQLTVPLSLAPLYSRRMWRFITATVVPELIMPAVLQKFRVTVDEWITQNWPEAPPSAVEFHASDGRILLRRRGYRIPPHRDPKWGFLTGILYLARRHDSESWGTQFFTVDDDDEAKTVSPHWINPERCRPAGEVEFKADRLLLFLNSVGAHGAQIPEDAEPATLERYIYQFRIGPTVEWISKLKTTLPDERRSYWAGKGGEY